jgi:hypothetical protein
LAQVERGTLITGYENNETIRNREGRHRGREALEDEADADGRSVMGNFAKRQSVRWEREAIADVLTSGRAPLKVRSVPFTAPKLFMLASPLCYLRTNYSRSEPGRGRGRGSGLPFVSFPISIISVADIDISI